MTGIIIQRKMVELVGTSLYSYVIMGVEAMVEQRT
jgi:hypothetical protein